MSLRPLVILAIIALALATGCATVTFKRGAGPGGAKADEDACRASSTSPEAYSDCLREKGWMVRTPNSGAGPVDPAVGEQPAPAPSGSSAHEPIPAPQPTPLPGGKPKTPPAHATPAAAAASDATGKPAKDGAVKTVPAAAAAPSSKPSPKPLEPTAHVTVQSWWKLGGTTSGLDAAIAACVGELGETHRPNAGATDVTVAMRDCLRRAKWFPVGGTGAK